MSRQLFGLVAVALAIAPASASADVIRAGPDCPPGWHQVIRHHQFVCDPGTCESGCAPGTTCREISMCLAMVKRYKQGHEAGEVEEAVGPCAKGVECAGRCEPRKLCVIEELAGAPPRPESSPLHAPRVRVDPPAAQQPKKSFCGVTGGDLLPLAAVLLVPALLRRRRGLPGFVR
ncbi:MAG: hypothetical protein QM765_46355 [Myxococcales bacterium]